MSNLLKCVIISDPVILGPACRHPLKIFYDSIFYYTNDHAQGCLLLHKVVLDDNPLLVHDDYVLVLDDK